MAAATEEGIAGRTALVTGGSRGIGRAIAVELARCGARVAVNYRENAAAATEVRSEIEGVGAQALTVAADVGDRAQVAAMVEAVEQGLGPGDLLVNNAGV